MARFSASSDTTNVPGVRCRFMPSGDLMVVEIPVGAAQVPVTLTDAAGFKVVSSTDAVIPNPIAETVDGDVHRLSLAPKDAGSAVILAENSSQRWALLQVQVYVRDPTRADRGGSPQGGAPAAGGGGGTPDPVAELLGVVEGASFSAGGRVQNLVDQAIKNLLRVFLYARRALEGRKLPVRNAVLVAAHTSVETTFGTLGPNAPIGNWFSIQLDEKTEKRKRIKAAFIARGVPMSNSARGNRASAGAPVTGSAVDNPIFMTKRGDVEDFDVAGMVEAQFDLVYGAPRDGSDPGAAPDPNALFSAIGGALMRSSIGATAFGAVIGQAYAGVGTPEGAHYAPDLGTGYDHVMHALRWFLGTPPPSVSETTKAWAAATLRDVPSR